MSTTDQAKNPQCRHCGAPLDARAPGTVCLRCALGHALDPVQETAAGACAQSVPAGGEMLAKASFPFHFGQYELLEEVARGGMGIVYRARQVSLGRIVAVKVLLAGRLAVKDFVQRFRTESAAAASLQHPNIVAIHEVGFADGQHFFAMDFVEGPTLGQLVAKGPLPARHAATYLKTVAEAIHFAHEHNVLHRDLKPSNVLVDSATDQPRLTDFGLAKRLEAETELTLTGQVLGSPNYMSPEQAVAKRGTVGKRSDVYSLGAILYHLLAGRPPFQGETLTDVLHQVVNDEPLDPHLLTPRVPRDLETICLKCLEKEPARRYQSAQELADELSRFLHDEPIKARPVTRFEQGWRWCRRTPALASLCAALVLVFTLGFSATFLQWRQAINNAQAEAKQRRLADTNLQLANANRERVNESLYESDMRLAQVVWDDGDFGLTLSLLEAHLPKSGELDRRGFEWFYFWNLCRGDQRMTLTNHTRPVSCVAFSPDGRHLATGSVGNPVQIWDTATGGILMTLPESNVVSLAFAPDGPTLGVGGRDQVIVWNLETEQVVFKRELKLGRFRIAFAPKGTLLMIGKHGDSLFGDGGTAELVDYLTDETKQVFPASGGYIALSPSADRLATRNSDQTMIWELASGQFVCSLNSGEVVAMAWSPDGRTLATSCWGLAVKLWDITSGEQIGSLTNNPYRVWDLAFSPDCSSLATAGADQIVRLWDVATCRQTERLHGHRGEVVSVAFSNDGQTLASGSKDNTALLWNLRPKREVMTVSNLTSRATFSPDSRLVAAGIGTNRVAIWNVATLEVQAIFPGAHDVLGFSADGAALITQGTNYFLRTFDVATQTVLQTIPGRPAGETFFYDALSPDGQILATGLSNGTLKFSNAQTGATIASKPHAYEGNFFKLAFSPDGKLLATAGMLALEENPAAQIWNTASQEKVAAPPGHTDVVVDVSFAPDGKTLITCGADDSIKFWDTTSWKEIPPSFGQREYLSALALSPKESRLATACSDGTMKLWNIATRRQVASLQLDLYGLYITFSPDGQTLAAQNGDGLLRVWRAPIHPNKKQSRPPDR